MGNSFGFFEIPSTTAAIDALDIMCKTADVEFVTWEKKLGGRLVTVIIKGNVSAVTQAIETAAVSAIKTPAAYTVIASPHEEVIRLIELSASRFEQEEDADDTSEKGGISDGGRRGSSEKADNPSEDPGNNC